MNSRVRAIIIKQNKILLIKRIKLNETYWVFPGGGVEPNEAKEEALIREIKEELGLDIKVKELFLERPSDKPGMEGMTEYFFTAHVVGGKLGSGKGPEYEPNSNYIGKYELEWINIADLPKISLKPQEVKGLVINGLDPKSWLDKTVDVKVDRPINSRHPDFPKNVYPINYGYIPNTKSIIDGEEIDAYVLGPSKPIEKFTGKVIAVIVRTDDEIKLVVTDGAKYSNKDIKQMIDFQEKYYQSRIIR